MTQYMAKVWIDVEDEGGTDANKRHIRGDIMQALRRHLQIVADVSECEIEALPDTKEEMLIATCESLISAVRGGSIDKLNEQADIAEDFIVNHCGDD